jgi:hypothetical protein
LANSSLLGALQKCLTAWLHGLKGNQVKRLKELEAESTRLRRAVSDLTLEKLILKEAASRNF